MKVLVLGRSGQVATALAQASARLPAGWTIETWGREQFDLDDVDSVFERVSHSAADAVINAAAYTAVDKAEMEEDAAFRLNAEAPGEAARAAAAKRIPFIHISTDYVFSGQKTEPYVETDPVDPLSAYGRSKAEGEVRVMAAYPQATILRTAWVFHEHGGNFVKTMLRLGRERDELRVVADQHGSPTYAGDIADACLAILQRVASGAKNTGGVFHFAGDGYTTWHGFATEIFAQGARLGFKCPQSVLAITTADYPTPAKRPANSRFDCSKIHTELGIAAPHWRAALSTCLERLAAMERTGK